MPFRGTEHLGEDSFVEFLVLGFFAGLFPVRDAKLFEENAGEDLDSEVLDPVVVDD